MAKEKVLEPDVDRQSVVRKGRGGWQREEEKRENAEREGHGGKGGKSLDKPGVYGEVQKS